MSAHGGEGLSLSLYFSFVSLCAPLSPLLCAWERDKAEETETEIMPEMHKSIYIYVLYNNDTKRQDGGGVVSEQEAEGRKVSLFSIYIL